MDLMAVDAYGSEGRGLITIISKDALSMLEGNAVQF